VPQHLAAHHHVEEHIVIADLTQRCQKQSAEKKQAFSGY
jgi:hypothetical protein